MFMTRRYPNTDYTYPMIVRNNGALVTPATIAFQWKIGRWGAWQSVTPVNIVSATYPVGYYTAVATPLYGGPLYYRWKTTGPRISFEGMDMIECSEFDTTGYGGSYDYGWGGWW